MFGLRARSISCLCVVWLTAGGCGYSVRPPYDQSIQTVYVPIFKSISYRRDINLQLTEMVVKEIETRTPFKVVGTPEGADTILYGTVKYADKNLIVENPFNLPRQLTATISVEVNWVKSGTETKVRPPVIVTQTINFVPEVGETSSGAFSKANQKLAQEIVNMMEKTW